MMVMNDMDFWLRMNNIKLKGDLLRMKLKTIQRMNQEIKISKHNTTNSEELTNEHN